MASCCGRQSAGTDYEVTFKDGSTRVVASLPEARIVIAQDTSTDPSGRRHSATFRAVPRKQ